MEIRIAIKDDIEYMMSSRLEMLREVNSLAPDYQYSQSFIESTRSFFLDGQQTTVLALDGDSVVGCATMCYITIMPTFSHPTGKRAHLMNVYTAKDYRRQGIGMKMVSMLINEAWNKGVTEISLDATENGRALYAKCGFTNSDELRPESEIERTPEVLASIRDEALFDCTKPS